MNVLITGATGLVGRALVLRLRRDGHALTAAVRDKQSARSLLGTEAELVGLNDDALAPAVAAADCVVNLAGEPIIGRWTARKRERILRSRVDLTLRLARMLDAAPRKSRVLLSASATGFYGDTGTRAVEEGAPRGGGFPAEVCEQWERAAMQAASERTRVAIFRLGLVLDRDGGVLGQLLPVFKLGIGGKLGSGAQFMSLIHLDDLCELFATALRDPRYVGVFNATMPAPLTNAEFTRALASAVGMPALVPVPKAALRLAFGEAASTMLASQRVLPRRALDLGFKFRHRAAADALSAIVSAENAISVQPLLAADASHDYLRARRPRYELRVRTALDAPLPQVFAFFCRPENLGLITPASMRFRITDAPASVDEGSRISYRLFALGAPIRWRTLITRWQEGRAFVDAQEQGPYHSWWHEHTFGAAGAGAWMEDRVWYAPPLGVLGRLANRWLIAPELKRIFAYRNTVIRRRFGDSVKENVDDRATARTTA